MTDGVARPALVVVSGPAGSGKTTLAHALAATIGCPAICRDEIKEGMVHAAGPGFVPVPGDELTVRALPVFFAVLELLLAAGVTTVAEAAFQDHLWRPRLGPLHDLARIRVVHCVVDPGLAAARVGERLRASPTRRAHADPRPGAVPASLPGHGGRPFRRPRLGVPSLQVDTTDGYRPPLAEISAFAGA